MPDLILPSAYGIRREITFENDSIVEKRFQRVDTIIDDFRQKSESVNKKAANRVVATIPRLTFFAWREEWKQKFSDKWTFATWLAMRLNSSDYSKLRNQRL
jgi:hypothetical protein